MMVSVLLITRDRRSMLERVLNDLRQQDFQGEYEIIVVEETDTPRAPTGVVYVSHPLKNLGIAYARNLSLKYAKYDILVFIDDDCRVEKDWLKQLLTPLEDEHVLGVQGGVVVPENTNGMGWAESLLGFPGGGVTRVIKAAGEFQKTLEISTLNACYRKDAVMQAGGFSEHARFGGEDYVLAKKVAEKGELLFAPLAQVKHEARGNMSSIWSWFVRRGRAEFDLWHSDFSPQGYGLWMLRSSFSLKLLPFIMFCYWSVLPLVLFVLLMVVANRWRFRWVLKHHDIPRLAWMWLPWVRMLMGLATDVGRIQAWRKR